MSCLLVSFFGTTFCIMTSVLISFQSDLEISWNIFLDTAYILQIYVYKKTLILEGTFETASKIEEEIWSVLYFAWCVCLINWSVETSKLLVLTDPKNTLAIHGKPWERSFDIPKTWIKENCNVQFIIFLSKFHDARIDRWSKVIQVPK